MITIDEAIAIIKEKLPPPRTAVVPLAEAAGRVLAEAVRAPEPSPRYDNSAMDGYALRYDDVAGCTKERPAVLRLVGESQAGVPFAGRLGAGEAVRISTGAMLPAGADTVVRVEDSEETDGVVRIVACRKRGQDVRFRGEEFDTGDQLLAAGVRLAAPHLALLAAVGIERVPVYQPPRVALLVTGTELAAPGGTQVADHQIRDSNTIMLAAAVAAAGGTVVESRRVEDDWDATVAAIGAAAGAADILLCSGGVSVGRHDHVKAAALEIGFEEGFWRIRQKPGKPLFFASSGDRLLFGLPGNPVSAFMCFVHYVQPVIAALCGRPFGWPSVSATAGEDIGNRGGRPVLLRVRLAWQTPGGFRITRVERQGSHMLTSLTAADGYVLVQPGERIAAGDRVEVFMFNHYCHEG